MCDEKMLLKNKFLFLIILVFALTSVSMVSAQDPSTNVTTSNVVDCASDLNTAENNVGGDLNHLEVEDISSTQESNVSISKNS